MAEVRNASKRKFVEEGAARVAKQPKVMHPSMLAEDGTLKYEFMTSLENIVIAKIATSLWMHQNQEIVNLFGSGVIKGKCEFIEAWQEIEKQIETNLSKLLLAKLCIKKLTGIVPLIGKSILDWIVYHDKYVFRTKLLYSAVEQIGKIAWTATGKIDYAQTARNILADSNSCLSSALKYRLACTYCFEDEIAALSTAVVTQDCLNRVPFDIYPMVYFWTTRITGDNTKFYNPFYHNSHNRPNDDLSINEHIMRLLIKHMFCVNRTFNEVPIRYMWNELNEEEKGRNISLLFKELGSQGFKYSLLSNLGYEQQRELFKKCSGNILCDMLNDWLWGEYFLPTALHVLDIMDPMSYSDILRRISKEMQKNSDEKNETVYNECRFAFKQLWQEGSKHLKDFLFEREDGHALETLLMVYLSWPRDVDIIQLILNDLKPHQKRKLIMGKSGVSHCVRLIEEDQWDLLELFINCPLSSKKDIKKLKERLKSKADNIAEHFVEKSELHKIERFMSWVFETEEEIDKFRAGLKYMKLDSNIDSDKVDFTRLENHFKWCAHGDLELINQFKTGVPYTYLNGKLIEELISEGKYDFLDHLLNWSFLNRSLLISLFKSCMHKKFLWSWSIRRLTAILIRKDDSGEMFDKFIGWLFADKLKAREFKMWTLYPQDDSFSMCTEFLREHEFELADKLVERCLTSPKEISKFKETLILTKDIKVILDGYFGEEAQGDLYALIKWFAPSPRTVGVLKNYISEKKCPKNFYNLLNKFLRKKIGT